jgi:hypothetical protein
MKTSFKCIVTRKAAILAAIVAWGSLMIGVNADGAKGGGTRLLELSGKTKAPVSVPAGAAMSCTSCKNEYTVRKDLTARGAFQPEVVTAKHLCGTCNTTFSVEGHGKAKQSTATHKCAAGTCVVKKS